MSLLHFEYVPRFNLKMEIESRKRHFNEDTSKKKYEKNLALKSGFRDTPNRHSWTKAKFFT